MNLQKNFNWLKYKKNLSFNRIYRMTGISISTLQVLAYGNQNNIRIETVIKLCNCFKVNINDFLFSHIEKEIEEITERYDSIDSLNLQKNVKYLKETNHLSYKKISIATKINMNTLHILLTGNEKNARIETVIKLAEFFEKSIDELVIKDITASKF